MHVGLDSRKPGPQNDIDRWIPSFDKGPRRVEQRFYMYKECKNKCKLETSRLQGWLINININASVLEQLGVKAPQLFNLIKKQKLSYFGHIKRHNTLEKLLLEGTCEGRRGRGRPRRRWTQDIGEWMGVSTVEAGRQALERGEFRHAVWEATVKIRIDARMCM